jgi:hypothetical protein
VSVPEGVIGIAAFAGFCVFWCMISALTARMGGWNALAKRYGVSIIPAGTVYRWQSMKIGAMASYNGAMNVSVSPRGLCLFPVLVFRFGHKPLLIPWSDVRIETEESAFGAMAALHIGHPEMTVIHLSSSLCTKSGIDRYARKAPTPEPF